MEKNNTDDEYIGKHNNYKAELEQIIPMILEGLMSQRQVLKIIELAQLLLRVIET